MFEFTEIDPRQGPKTIEMHKFLQSLFLDIEGKEHLVLNGAINFANKITAPIVSIGENPTNREVILLDPNSSFLQEKFEKLLEKIGNERDPANIFKIISKFVRNEIPEHTNIEVKLAELCKKWQGKKIDLQDQEVPLIPLEYFCDGFGGVCRHHALLASYFLGRLTQMQLLNNFEIYHYRTYVQSPMTFGKGGHVFVIAKDMNTKELWLIDTLWNICINLNDKESLKMAEMCYSEDTIKEIFQRHGDQINQKKSPNDNLFNKLDNNNIPEKSIVDKDLLIRRTPIDFFKQDYNQPDSLDQNYLLKNKVIEKKNEIIKLKNESLNIKKAEASLKKEHLNLTKENEELRLQIEQLKKMHNHKKP